MKRVEEKLIENKGGRPRKEIDFETFEKLCTLQCTKLEICEFFGLTDKTLERRVQEHYDMGFSEVFKIKRSPGKISLRRTQFELAKKSPAMAIFLGKNYLGQSDKYETKVSGEIEIISIDRMTDEQLIDFAAKRGIKIADLDERDKESSGTEE